VADLTAVVAEVHATAPHQTGYRGDRPKAVRKVDAPTVRVKSGGPRRDAALNPIVARVKEQLIALAAEHSNRVEKYSPDQERVPAGTPDGGEFAGGGGTPEAITTAEASHWKDADETAVCVGRDGALLLAKPGDRDSVEFTDAEVAKVAASPGATFTHNHPSGWRFADYQPEHRGNGPSRDDLRLAIAMKLGEMRVTTPTSLYVVTPPDGRSHFDEQDRAGVLQVMMDQYDALHAEWQPKVTSGEMTVGDANVNHHDELWKRTAALTGVGYSKNPYSGGG